MKIKLQIPDYEPIIFNNVELSFGEEEKFLIIHGSNGCGKSTLLHILLGLKKSSGVPKIVVDDKRIYNTIECKETIRYLPQNSEDGLFPRLSVEDNILLLKRLLNIKDNFSDTYIDDAKKSLAYLSVGQKRNLLLDAILKSLPSVDNFGDKPIILLLDEPFAGLDIERKQEAFDRILGISKKYKDVPLKFLMIDHQNIIPDDITLETEVTLRNGIIFRAIQCKKIDKVGFQHAVE